ncbi:MAG: hypothetical protein E4G99_11055 [Anaerolineales bacterium]|nr:MAG: hypothetical protein E4G99_11055 [Anaerolineales bacterium]
MPRILCRYIDCVYLEDGFCGTVSIELDPDEGCLKYTRIGEVPEDEDWEEEEEEELVEIWDADEEDLYVDSDEDDDWVEEPDL